MVTSVCVLDSGCDGTAGWSDDLATDAAATGALGRLCIAGRLPKFRRWCRTSWAIGGGKASNACCPALSFEGLFRNCTGGPWCREALNAADGESSFQDGVQWRTGFGWRGMGAAADGTCGVAAPKSRAISQLDWATQHWSG